MKFTISWLKEYLETDCDLNSIVNRLNEIGLEVDNVIDNSEAYKNFNCVVVEECINHPDSDHLHICQVRYSNDKEPITIVCGAPNVRSGLKTILCPAGCCLPNGTEIKKTKIRGVESNGMLCSEKELGLGDNHTGIIEIPETAKIGENIVNILNLNDPLIDISITPNKGDCLSVYGIARDLACAGIGKLKKLEDIKINNDFTTNTKLKVTDNNCPIFYFREIKNLKNCESPDWIKKRLKSIDINPKNALVDITNYVMMCFGRPLHCYDKSKINGDVLVYPANGGETFTDLFDKEYKLNDKATIIGDKDKILCLGGIMGSNTSGSSLDTNNIILECAVFDPINTARTSRLLNISSDSKYRFERGVDPDITEFVLNYATNLILDICDGEASDIVKHEDENFIKTNVLELNYDYIEELLGINIDKEDIFNILETMDYKIKDNDNILSITVPHYKNNILVKEDIIDDIIRIYGYDKLKTGDFIDTNIFEKDGNLFNKKYENKLYSVRNALAGNGYTELITYSFLNEKDSSYFAETKDELKIINPIIEDFSYMRQSLLPNILNIIKKNNNRGYYNLSFFEIGHIFNKANIDSENNIITAIRSGSNKEKDIYRESRNFDVFDLKKDLFDTLEVLGINGEKMNIDNNTSNYYHPNRSGAVYMGKTLIAYFGELHPNINSIFELKNRTIAFELFLDKLPKKIFLEDKSKNSFKPDDLQPIMRDFAFIISNDVKVGDILKNIYALDKEYITNVHLFDVYSDDKMEGKKSIAFTITIQPKNENMNKDDIDKISNNVIEYITKEFNGVLRDK